jgi:hypothetical protein
MRYCLTLLIYAMLMALPLKANTMTSTHAPLSISLQCLGNAGCVYERKPIDLLVTIRNDGSRDIGFPLDYLRKSGPIVKFIDTDTGAVTYARRGLANPALKTQFTTIAPGASISMEIDVHPTDIETFRIKKVDISVEVILKGDIRIDGEAELQDYQGGAKIRIVEKDE